MLGCLGKSSFPSCPYGEYNYILVKREHEVPSQDGPPSFCLEQE